MAEWGGSWTRDGLVAHGMALAGLGFGIVRVYHPLDAEMCSCAKGAGCTSIGKHPIGDDWPSRVEHDPARVRTLLSNPGNRSYGIVPPPGTFAWDVDGDVPDRLRELTGRLGSLPPTRVHQSGNGKHVLYRWPDAIPGDTGHHFGIVTRRAPSGMVVGPGSVHAATGLLYAVERDVPVAELPASWARAAAEWSDRRHAAQDQAEDGDPDWTVEAGNRHAFLVRQAGRLRNTGLRGEDLVSPLLAINRKRCSPPKPEDEVREIARYFDGRADDRGGEPLVLASGGSGSSTSSTSGRLVFRTAAEIAASALDEVESIVPGLLVCGAATELSGKVKSAGKTTFALALTRAVLDGHPFLGLPTMCTGVVYLSEQPQASLREALRRADLLERSDLAVLLFAEARGRSWAQVVEAAVEECLERGARLLVIDTLPQWAGVKDENDASEALRAMAAVQAATAAGIAVLLVRHDRKSAGDVGDSGRGSSAFSGAVDIVLRLRRGEGGTASNVRILEGLSRFDGTPEDLAIEFVDGRYVALGDAGALALRSVFASLVAVLTATPGATINELDDTVTGSRTNLQRAIAQGIEDGSILRTGKGVKGDPHRHYTPDSAAGA